MTTATCAGPGCKNPVVQASTGRPAKFCSSRCRTAALRDAAGRPAAEPTPVDTDSGTRNETPQRGSYAGRDYGDGDRCPQDPSHGSMYFCKPAMQLQWCPSSRHHGSPFYLRDGVSPASRSAAAEPAPTNAARQRQPDQLLTETPVPVGASPDGLPAGLARGAVDQPGFFPAT